MSGLRRRLREDRQQKASRIDDLEGSAVPLRVVRLRLQAGSDDRDPQDYMPMTNRDCRAFAVYICTGLLCWSACVSSQEPNRLALSNGSWQVSLLGETHQSGRSGDRRENAYVQFMANTAGVLYASGILYEAGPRDLSFAARFPALQWVHEDVLRFFRQPERMPPTLFINVQNATNREIGWLVISYQELFLTLKLRQAESRGFTGWKWGDPHVRVTGEFAQGVAVTEGTLLMSEATKRIQITVREEQTEVREIK